MIKGVRDERGFWQDETTEEAEEELRQKSGVVAV
jgi:hypothetical protein